MSTAGPLHPGGAPTTCDLRSDLPTSEDFRSSEMLTEPPAGLEFHNHAGPTLQKQTCNEGDDRCDVGEGLEHKA
jgi:hypothetical protein